MGGGLKSIIIKTNVKPKYFTIACAEMYMYIGVISKIYKNIKIIHCERNFKDLAVSLYKGHYKNQNMNWTNDLSEIVNFYKFHNENMKYWDIPENIMKSIKYEDLVKNFSLVTHDLEKFLDIDKQDLDFFYQKREKVTSEDNISLNKKINTDLVDDWKNYERYICEINYLFAYSLT